MEYKRDEKIKDLIQKNRKMRKIKKIRKIGKIQ